jgi:predicted RNA-binding protein
MAKLYEAKESNKPVLEDIARLTIVDGEVEAETLFGGKKVFRGKIRYIDFLKSQIRLETN